MKRRALPDWFVIARREFLERVRTKWFVIVTALGPVALIAMIVLPVVLAGAGTRSNIQIVDRTGTLAAPIAKDLRLIGWTVEEVPAATTEATLLGRIHDKTIDGFLTIPRDALDARTRIEYQGENASSQVVSEILRYVVTQEIQRARGIADGLDGKKLDDAMKPVDFHGTHTTGEAGGATGMAVFFLGYAVMFVLYMAIVLYAVNVMGSIVQEKTNRVVEIMVAAAKPRALMFGKILGVGAVGLVQIGAWMTMAVLMIEYREPILGLFGASGGFAMPPLGAADAVVIVLYFFLGYFFYASLYAAIGAMVSSEQEARQAQVPVTFLLIIPMVCISIVANDPRGGAAEALTLIPFSSPILMPMRWLLGGASTLDALLSLGILAASTWIIASLSARIYRVGILMYGKRPGLRELARWLRYS